MYLTACLDQPLHYAGEGMAQDYRLTHLVMGNGGQWGAQDISKVGEKGSCGSCVPLSIQAAHRRTIRMSM